MYSVSTLMFKKWFLIAKDKKSLLALFLLNNQQIYLTPLTNN